MNTPLAIVGTELVIGALGHWPSFHDAEVVGFELHQNEPFGASPYQLRLDVYLEEYESRNEGTALWSQVLVQSAIIRFEFEQVREVDIAGFDVPSMVDRILVEQVESEGALRVEVKSNLGFCGNWLCQVARVQSVNPGPRSVA